MGLQLYALGETKADALPILLIIAAFLLALTFFTNHAWQEHPGSKASNESSLALLVRLNIPGGKVRPLFKSVEEENAFIEEMKAATKDAFAAHERARRESWNMAKTHYLG